MQIYSNYFYNLSKNCTKFYVNFARYLIERRKGIIIQKKNAIFERFFFENFSNNFHYPT